MLGPSSWRIGRTRAVAAARGWAVDTARTRGRAGALWLYVGVGRNQPSRHKKVASAPTRPSATALDGWSKTNALKKH